MGFVFFVCAALWSLSWALTLDGKLREDRIDLRDHCKLFLSLESWCFAPLPRQLCLSLFDISIYTRELVDSIGLYLIEER
jgi:hypothetical protein